ncbi:MAG: hypothetical protein ABR598_04250 [Candidatus Dormibacteria bacterium]
MPRGRPVGSRTRKPRAGVTEADRSLLAGVRGLVERVAELETENRRLRQLLDEISQSLQSPSGASSADAPRRRGRPPKVQTTGAEDRPRRGRPRKTPGTPKVRRKITDPVVLEKRRAALAKARAVRAERLAAAKG